MFVNVIPLKECFPNWPKPVVFDSSYIDTRWLLPYTRHAISACVPLSRETYVYRTESPTLFKTCFCDTASRHFLDREMDDVVWHSQKTDGMFVSYTCRMNNCSIPQHCKTLFFGLRTQSKRCAQLAIIKKKSNYYMYNSRSQCKTYTRTYQSFVHLAFIHPCNPALTQENKTFVLVLTEIENKNSINEIRGEKNVLHKGPGY